MKDNSIELVRKGPIATLAINRPERRNALSQSMWETMAEYLDEVAADNSIRTLKVTGHGGCFSAGADISEFTEIASDPERLRVNNHIVQVAQQKLEELAKPTIAVIDGACIGGGCGLALACDIRIASDTSFFAITPAKLGLIYSLRDTRRLLALVGPAFTKEMLYTGTKLDSALALEKGIINRRVAASELADTAQQLAQQLASGSQYSIRGIKQIIAALEGYGTLDEDAAQQLFDEAFTAADCQEGVQAFLDKRPANFTWN